MTDAELPDDSVDPTGVDPIVEGALSDPEGLRALADKRRGRVSAGQARVNELLAKYHDRPLLDVGLRIYQRDRESAGAIVGSALAFRLFLFVVPLTLFVVGLFGFLASWTDPDDVNGAAGVSGTLAAQIKTALSQPNSTRWIATLSGLVGTIWTGRTLSKVMVTASCLTWRLPVTSKARLRVVGAIVGLIVGIGIASAIVNRIRVEVGVGVAGLSFVAAFAVYVVAWMAMSMLLPRATSDPGALLPGAVLVAAILTAMQAISQLYLPEPARPGVPAVRRDRHDGRDSRLVLLRRPGDGARHGARRRDLRTLRQHLAVRVLPAGHASATPEVAVDPEVLRPPGVTERRSLRPGCAKIRPHDTRRETAWQARRRHRRGSVPVTLR